MSAIVVKYVFTEAIALRGNRELVRVTVPWVRFLPLIGLLMSVLLAYGWIAKGVAPWVGINPLIVGPLLCAIPFLTRRQVSKQYRANPSAGKQVTWRIDETRLSNETEGAQSVFEWKMLIRAKEMKDGFLLFPQVKLAFWIPKDAFSSESDLAQFRMFIRASGIKQ